ncbi:3-deoxy-manno-octulosonate-8-phosphatase KdsC [Glaciecola sp. KUL10]|uniref:3-deoxy-manno-octulosonate-8-phosphatase KdsC n=1 Tax=Glaciecola sp. (strain KUL10) TaxID=2161813 RepID=UPI000D78338B|nr:3-deoxy-manno-octulosonate-8-phosphatase KdsC [Glaciecola sp. KUL10]GBL04895.1 3-deoxy-D-manno-octulosonate 8-phosphate phosphatase [Glaciecola sp. KUL10]
MSATTETLYGNIDTALFSRFSQIKLLVCDVDGVFSDGNIYLGNNGEELKGFNTKDGYGIKSLDSCGVDVAVITGRRSTIVENRMNSLGVKHLVQGRVDKDSAIKEIMALCGVSKHEVASVGDDMPDIGMFANSAIGIAVADAHPFVKQKADFVTLTKGGKGAVREVCDILLQSKGSLESIHGASV